MVTPHANRADIVDVRPLGSDIERMQTTTLVKSNALQMIRLILPAGKEIPTHYVLGEITAQCVEGKILFGTEEGERELLEGDLIYLPAAAEHSVCAVEDSSALVTILLNKKQLI